MALLSTLQDPFTATPDSALWTITGSGSTTYTEGVGLVQSGYTTLSSVDVYDFDSASMRLDVDVAAWYSFTVGQEETEENPWPSNRQMWMSISPGSNAINAWWQGYDAAWDPGSPPTNDYGEYGGVKSGTYDPIAMRYLKMTNVVDGGVLTATYETSPDGDTWTLFFQFTATPSTTYPYKVFLGGSSNTHAVLANFNSSPVVSKYGGVDIDHAYNIQIVDEDPFVSDSISSGEYTGTAPSATGYRTAWFKYTPLTTYAISVDSLLSVGADTILYLYSSTGPPHSSSTLTLIASNDDFGGEYTSSITNVTVTEGVTYFIALQAYDDNPTYAYILRLTKYIPPPLLSSVTDLFDAGLNLDYWWTGSSTSGSPFVMVDGRFRFYDGSSGSAWAGLTNQYELDSVSVLVDEVQFLDYAYKSFQISLNGETTSLSIGIFSWTTTEEIVRAQWNGYSNLSDMSDPLSSFPPEWNLGGAWYDIAFNATTMKYFRITNTVDGDRVTTQFSTSSDSATWDNVFSFTADLVETIYNFEMVAQNSIVVYLDNFNVLGFEPLSIEVPLFTQVSIESFEPTVSLLSWSNYDVDVPIIDVSLELYAPTVTGNSYLHVDVPVFNNMSMTFVVSEVTHIYILLLSPANNGNLPINVNPEFRIAFIADSNDVSIDIQVDYDSSFPMSIYSASGSVTATDTDGLTPTKIVLDTTLVLNTYYYWRYRFHIDGQTLGWSTPIAFSTMVGVYAGATYTGSWTIASTGTSAPTIWFLYPSSGQAGSAITIYGQGLNVSSAQVFVGAVAASIQSKTTVAEDSVLPPVIDSATPLVTVAHDEVVFIIPEVDSPGSSVTVEV